MVEEVMGEEVFVDRDFGVEEEAVAMNVDTCTSDEGPSFPNAAGNARAPVVARARMTTQQQRGYTR